MSGVIDTKNISPIGNLIAYDMALGLDYGDIATNHSLTLDQVAKMARGNLVQKKVREHMAALEARMLEDTAENPVRRFLHSKGLVAGRRLVDEMDNEDPELGASASTRIKAAEAVLKLGGHTPKEESSAVSMVINISAGKAEMAGKIAKEVIEHAPDYVDG